MPFGTQGLVCEYANTTECEGKSISWVATVVVRRAFANESTRYYYKMVEDEAVYARAAAAVQCMSATVFPAPVTNAWHHSWASCMGPGAILSVRSQVPALRRATGCDNKTHACTECGKVVAKRTDLDVDHRDVSILHPESEETRLEAHSYGAFCRQVAAALPHSEVLAPKRSLQWGVIQNRWMLRATAARASKGARRTQATQARRSGADQSRGPTAGCCWSSLQRTTRLR